MRTLLSVALSMALLPVTIGAAEEPEHRPTPQSELPKSVPAPKTKSREGLDPALAELASKAESSKAQARAFGRSRKLVTDGDSVVVEVRALPGREASSADKVRSLGGEASARHRQRVLARVPVEALEQLAVSPEIVSVRRPMPVKPAVTSEGVGEINATTLHMAGIDGEGIKIGIIDVGFASYETKLGSELPSSVTTWTQGLSGDVGDGTERHGTERHGTAVAEIVHDVAPKAELFLAQATMELEIGAAADWMVSQGVDVINMSAVMPGFGPGDGTGTLNEIIDETVAAGVFWANAVGNSRQTHWGGDFVPLDYPGADPNFNDFLPGEGSDDDQSFYAVAGDVLEASLTWRDSWTNANQDYDLHLWFWTGSAWQLVEASGYAQDGSAGSEPWEYIAVHAPQSGHYGWSIYRDGASQTDVDLDLFDMSQLGNLEYPVAERSFGIPADNGSEGFVAVGAVGRSPFTQEVYSSEGPTRAGAVTPELVAPSKTQTSIYSGGFSGTSASSPHVAGAAALVLQSRPDSSPADLEWYLENNAIDAGPSGIDNQYGSGRLWLPLDLFSQLPSSPATLSMGTEPADYILWLKTGDDLDLAIQQPAGEPTVTASVLSLPGTQLSTPSGEIAFTAPTGGVYIIRFTGTPDDPRTADFSVTWSRTKASRVALSAAPAVTGYGKATTLRADFYDSDNDPVAGSVRFYYSYDNTTWKTLATVATIGGRASKLFTPTRRTYIRAQGLAQAAVKESTSAPITAQRYALLTTPASTTKARRNVAFAVSGYLRPRHAAGTSAVRLYWDRYEKGTWVRRKTVYSKVSTYNTSTSKYASKVALPYVGKWRVRAYVPGDKYHASTYSGYRYVKVQPTSLSISSNRNTVTRTTRATLTGVLRDMSGRALSGKVVYLERSTDRSTWIRHATLKTSTTGVVRASVLPRSKTYYRFRFAGDSSQMPSLSAVKTIWISY